VAESLLMLAATVLIFRTFAAEGYLISTGSMAPTLLGYHKQVTCPTCSHQFAKGISVEEAEGSTSMASTASANGFDLHGATGTACPNCGRTGLTVDGLPKNEGDQLLVNKHAFALRSPHRWEVIVFRNPSEPLEAYVKRAVGMPGESIEIRGGEVYANGVRQRKSLAAQLGTRILVDEQQNQPDPDSEDWEPRWSAETAESNWSATDSGFRYEPAHRGDSLDWLEFRHWIVSGGTHRTEVPLAAWPQELTTPSSEFSDLQYDAERRLLSLTGALTAAERDRWLERTEDPEFHKALNRLYRRSHLAPITDEYGYNQRYEGTRNFPVRDLMLEFTINQWQSTGQLVAQLADGSEHIDFQFDFAAGQVRIAPSSNQSADRQLKLPQFKSGPHQILVSIFDGQAVVAIDEQPIGEPLPLADAAGEPAAAWRVRPARIGATGVALSASDLRLYRDVYYTPKNGADQKTFALRDDEYFVLGDNSPVSVDSRCWESPGVPERSLIGKPFVVHLPSRPGKVEWGGKVTYVRVPDFERVRFIR
jgi:signal peptidase I